VLHHLGFIRSKGSTGANYRTRLDKDGEPADRRDRKEAPMEALARICPRPGVINKFEAKKRGKRGRWTELWPAEIKGNRRTMGSRQNK
jgi:hypothetical protein